MNALEDFGQKLEEAKRRVAHLEEKAALYQAILEHRTPGTTNHGNWEKFRHIHCDVFYSPSVTTSTTLKKHFGLKLLIGFERNPHQSRLN